MNTNRRGFTGAEFRGHFFGTFTVDVQHCDVTRSLREVKRDRPPEAGPTAGDYCNPIRDAHGTSCCYTSVRQILYRCIAHLVAAVTPAHEYRRLGDGASWQTGVLRLRATALRLSRQPRHQGLVD